MIKILMMILLLAFTMDAQITAYNAKGTSQERLEAARFTLALAGIKDSSSRDYVIDQLENFSPNKDQANQIFKDKSIFKPIDLTLFRQVFNTLSLPEKNALIKTDRVQFWRINFAYILSSEKLTRQQQNYIFRLSDYLDNATKDGLREYFQEATAIFSQEQGRKIFGTIGKWKCEAVTRLSPGDCNCNLGSRFNVTCGSRCGTSTTGCSATEDGCGFLGFYSCNSGCA